MRLFRSSNRIDSFWDLAQSFHGMACPLLALGVRICDTALSKLQLENPEPGRLVCVSEFDGCCVDAIQACLHCTTGTKHLLFYKTGKLIFNVYDLSTGASVRMCALPRLADTIRGTDPKEILNAPVEDLFTFEQAHPLTSRTLHKVTRTCSTPGPAVPSRTSGVQDCPDQFRKFDIPN